MADDPTTIDWATISWFHDGDVMTTPSGVTYELEGTGWVLCPGCVPHTSGPSTPVPELSTGVLLGVSVLAVAIWRRWRP